MQPHHLDPAVSQAERQEPVGRVRPGGPGHRLRDGRGPVLHHRPVGGPEEHHPPVRGHPQAELRLLVQGQGEGLSGPARGGVRHARAELRRAQERQHHVEEVEADQDHRPDHAQPADGDQVAGDAVGQQAPALARPAVESGERLRGGHGAAAPGQFSWAR
ncbi:MAG: hypothetical protein MUF66_12020 [Gammaproteobacteria bacterium]|nr:hypothetical protein [Gammaproteobacteria bacterium]